MLFDHDLPRATVRYAPFDLKQPVQDEKKKSLPMVIADEFYLTDFKIKFFFFFALYSTLFPLITKVKLFQGTANACVPTATLRFWTSILSNFRITLKFNL